MRFILVLVFAKREPFGTIASVKYRPATLTSFSARDIRHFGLNGQQIESCANLLYPYKIAQRQAAACSTKRRETACQQSVRLNAIKTCDPQCTELTLVASHRVVGLFRFSEHTTKSQLCLHDFPLPTNHLCKFHTLGAKIATGILEMHEVTHPQQSSPTFPPYRPHTLSEE